MQYVSIPSRFSVKSLIGTYRYFQANPEAMWRWRDPEWPESGYWHKAPEFFAWFRRRLDEKINRNDKRTGRWHKEEYGIALDRLRRELQARTTIHWVDVAALGVRVLEAVRPRLSEAYEQRLIRLGIFSRKTRRSA